MEDHSYCTTPKDVDLHLAHKSGPSGPKSASLRSTHSPVISSSEELKQEENLNPEVKDSDEDKCKSKRKVCYKCQLSFKNSFTLRRHLNNVHSDNHKSSRTSKMHRCMSSATCAAMFTTSDQVIEHAVRVHGEKIDIEYLDFTSKDDFLEYKTKEEKANITKFVCRNISYTNNKGNMSYVLECHRNGFSRSHTPRQSTKSNNFKRKRQRLKGHTQLNIFCPSRFKVTEKKDGKICVKYTKTHTHALAIEPNDHLKDEIQKRHRNSLKINNNKISQVADNTFTIDFMKKKIMIERIRESCIEEHCNSKCKEAPCVDLCIHLYKCSCMDFSKKWLCRHIHKIHGLDIQGQGQGQYNESLNDVKTSQRYNENLIEKPQQGSNVQSSHNDVVQPVDDLDLQKHNGSWNKKCVHDPVQIQNKHNESLKKIGINSPAFQSPSRYSESVKYYQIPDLRFQNGYNETLNMVQLQSTHGFDESLDKLHMQRLDLQSLQQYNENVQVVHVHRPEFQVHCRYNENLQNDHINGFDLHNIEVDDSEIDFVEEPVVDNSDNPKSSSEDLDGEIRDMLNKIRSKLDHPQIKEPHRLKKIYESLHSIYSSMN